MEGLTLYQWLSLLGAGSLIGAGYQHIIKKVQKNTADNEAVKIGMQALLRSQMISDYTKWTERGYAPIYAKENFENCWKQYHSLGVNGVMDGLHDDFMRLPVVAPSEG